jgi:nucleoside-diphosphate-sugar epimerase
MRVLITGSSGRIGAAVAREVRAAHQVVGLDVVPGAETQVLGSIADGPLVRALVRDVDAVIHCAALHAPHVGTASSAEFRAINVDGTARLLDASLAAGLRRFVFTSTTSVYGHALVPTDRAVWVTESLVPQPRDIYDETKLLAEALCQRATDAGLPCVTLRMSRSFPEPERLMAIYRMYRGVDARDVAAAHGAALRVPVSGYTLCNVSASSPFTIDDTPELLANAPSVLERYFPWIAEAFRARQWALPRSIDRVYVVDRARVVLHYESQYDVAAFLAASRRQND